MGYGQHTDHFERYSDHFTPEAESEIFSVLWELKKKGLSESTIKNNAKLLKFLAKHINLDDPESVRGYVAMLDKNDSYKRNLVLAYQNYAKVKGIEWTRPKYYPSNRPPQIPSEDKVNMIIANSPKKLALAISISRDIGMRPVEAMNLRLRDLDIEKGLIHPNTAKHGAGRVLKVKNSTLNLLASFLTAHQGIGAEGRLFGDGNSEDYGK